MQNKHKYHNLDGLRGFAALIVVFWHFTIAFLPFLVGTEKVSRHTPFDHLVSNTPLFLPFAGTFSVYIFFVLSGFVLSLSYFRRKDVRVLTSSAARRYFRLMIPAAGSVLFAFLAMTIVGTNQHLIAARSTGSSWLAYFWHFQPNFFGAFFQGIYGIFFSGDVSYNTNLWTMQVELYGSFIVFAFLVLFGALQRRWVIYLALALLFIKTNYLAFLLGVAICDIWVNYPHLKARISNRVALLLLGVGVVLGSWRAEIPGTYEPFYAGFGRAFLSQSQVQILALTIGAVCIIIAVLRLKLLTTFFELPLLQYLGRISFSLYLVHWVFLYSFSCYIFNKFMPHIGYSKSVVVTFVISIPIIFAISTVYAKYVDVGSIGWSKSVGSWLTKGLVK